MEFFYNLSMIVVKAERKLCPETYQQGIFKFFSANKEGFSGKKKTSEVCEMTHGINTNRIHCQSCCLPILKKYE